MIERFVTEKIRASLKKYPVVGILGSRQVGKTTLAKVLKAEKNNSLYLDLELPSDINRLHDPELFLSRNTDKLVIIDEIQRMPQLFPLIRALVDQKRTPGRFLILGSASPVLIKHASESLAGRIIYHELMPFLMNEIGSDQDLIMKLWLRGGYPDSFLSMDDADSLDWRNAFIKTYLERDIPQLGLNLPAITLRRFWTMLAHLSGQLFNASAIARSLGLSAPTVSRYLDIMVDTFIVRRLEPFFPNVKKRLTKSPKVYIRDSGLLHALLMADSMDLLSSNPIVGNSWEGFIIEQIIGAMPDLCRAYFYRTDAGAEMDMVIVSGKKITGVEIKYSLSPKPTKGFWSALTDIGCKKAFIVYPGKETYLLSDNVHVVPASNISNIFSK
jgi:uncharacterized protein